MKEMNRQPQTDGEIDDESIHRSSVLVLSTLETDTDGQTVRQSETNRQIDHDLIDAHGTHRQIDFKLIDVHATIRQIQIIYELIDAHARNRQIG